MNGVLVAVLNTLVIAGALVSAVTAVHAPRLIGAVLALAATGSFVGLEFILLQAPDVAIAEVSVGAILSTILYIVALRKVREVNIRDTVVGAEAAEKADGRKGME
ncbi:Na(+)/H(+) antiporter subunit B [Lachnoclostridium sp. Marseille-P6806]|uniref:Na(+)/H(+) antiporter subunit B n=1 Tax=Lachnoclostridium sp. Marseille-P6806 TaxID=2364793 RepID=UPI001031703A|nr:hydrogenase subunit MbhD domain-containing protein [Lachnoclostridium sp. Marseille-P6806]